MRTKLKILQIVIPISLICMTIIGCDGDGDDGTTQPSPETTPPPKIVCIDPGHGGSALGTLGWDDMVSDSGDCDWKYDSEPDFPNEADINLDIAVKLNGILLEQGFTVIMTRDTDANVSLSKRVEIAKNNNSDIFISIHCNAEACKSDGDKPENDANGTETWYASGDTGGSRLAGYVQEELVKSLGLKDRGKKETQTFTVLTDTKKKDGTKLPAALAETAFLTNKDDFNYIRNHTQDAANAIGNGILRYFGKQPMFALPRLSVQITRIYYDGSVSRVESDEYVEIKNLGATAQEMYGWVLKDISEGYPSFVFPQYILEPGVTIRVYTNEIHPEWGGFSFNYGKAIWNNTTPDIAALYDTQGIEISRNSY